MANRVRVLPVPEVDRVELARRVRAKGSPAREVERARIVLLAAQGLPGKTIAERVGCAEPTVVLWRRRYDADGLAGLADAPRSGKPPTIPQAVRDQILAITLTAPPTELGITHWSSRLLAERLRKAGTPVSHATVARVWKHFGIQPHRSGTFKFSTDPQLEAKVRDASPGGRGTGGQVGVDRVRPKNRRGGCLSVGSPRKRESGCCWQTGPPVSGST